MEFHVTLWQVLTGSWLLIIFVLLGIFGIVFGVVWGVRFRGTERVITGAMMLLMGVTLAGFMLWTAATQVGSGWSIKNGMVSVRTGFGNLSWPMRSVTTQWVSPDGPKKLTIRIGGYAAGQLQMGLFRLEDGTQAWVVRAGTHPWLLMRYDLQQVLISTPNVQALQTAIDESRTAPGTAIPNPPPSGDTNVSAVVDSGRLHDLVLAILSSVVFTGAQLLLSRYYAPRMPEKMVTHWGFSGQPNGWMSKRVGIWMLPCVSALLSGLTVLFSSLTNEMAAVVSLWPAQVIILLVGWWMYHMNTKR